MLTILDSNINFSLSEDVETERQTVLEDEQEEVFSKGA
jgi:hypothetical protein